MPSPMEVFHARTRKMISSYGPMQVLGPGRVEETVEDVAPPVAGENTWPHSSGPINGVEETVADMPPPRKRPR